MNGDIMDIISSDSTPYKFGIANPNFKNKLCGTFVFDMVGSKVGKGDMLILYVKVMLMLLDEDVRTINFEGNCNAINLDNLDFDKGFGMEVDYEGRLSNDKDYIDIKLRIDPAVLGKIKGTLLLNDKDSYEIVKS